jgi:hypothetical protein
VSIVDGIVDRRQQRAIVDRLDQASEPMLANQLAARELVVRRDEHGWHAPRKLPEYTIQLNAPEAWQVQIQEQTARLEVVEMPEELFGRCEQTDPESCGNEQSCQGSTNRRVIVDHGDVDAG